MEGCSKRSAGAAASDLPDDLLLEILSRVPAKSVYRFKCVSKAWRDLIADPDHHKKLRQPMRGLFVRTSEESKFDCRSFSFIDLILRSVPMDIDPSFSFLTEMTGMKAFLFDSCNGLILFGHRQEPSEPLSYTVCNPTTKQWSAVPACVSGEGLRQTYLGFDPAVSSHFHLLQFQITSMFKEIVVSLHVYSSETGTWSQNHIDEQKEQGQLEGWHHRFTLDIETRNHLCAFVNGFLHVIVCASGSGLQHILVVDVQGKARRLITVPGVADGSHGHSYVCYLGQSQGHLHCVTLECDKIEKVSIWVLQDYSTQEWVLKNTADLNSLDVFGGTRNLLEFQVVDIHQDCNVLFFIQLSQSYYCMLIAYDMDHKEVSIIATFNDYKEPCDFARYVPYFSESLALTNKHRKCVLQV